METLYETATRPHEFLGLRKIDVAFDDLGAIVFISKGKTGARRVRIFNAVVPLAAWIKNHPMKNRDAYLWVDMSSTTKYRTLTWIGLNRLIRRTATRAGVEKRINPYIFRHTRLTQLSKTFTEAQLSAFAGWMQGSVMASSYVHLSGRDVDAALLKAHGLSNIEDKPIGNIPSKCVRCGTWCEAEAEMCGKCGMALTLEAAMKRDEEIQRKQKKNDELHELYHQDHVKLMQFETAMPKILDKIESLEKRGSSES